MPVSTDTTNKIYIGDVNAAGAPWYDISHWVDAWPTRDAVDAFAQTATLEFEALSNIGTQTLPVVLVGGQEVMFYGHDNTGAGNHDYRASGKILVLEDKPTAEGLRYKVQIEGWMRELNAPIPAIQFTSTGNPEDTARIQLLLQRGMSEGWLPGSWSYSGMSGPFISFPAGTQTIRHSNIYDAIQAIAQDPGQPNDIAGTSHYPIPPRRWYVAGEWSDPLHPGTGGKTAIRRVFYYLTGSSAGVPNEPIPLTDRADSQCDLAYDTFNRSNDAMAVSLDYADTNQQWIGPSGSQYGSFSGYAGAYAYSHIAGKEAHAWLDLPYNGINRDIELGITFTINGPGQGIGFRWAQSGSAWVGYYVENVAGTGYRIVRRNADGTSTVLATTSGVTPVDGDRIRVLLSGYTITVYRGATSTTPIVTATDSAFAGTLHGLYASATVTGTPLWDNFEAKGLGNRYFAVNGEKPFQRTRDLSGLTNAVAIEADSGEGVRPNWRSTVRAGSSGDGGLAKTNDNVTTWQASTSYAASDYIQPTKPDGYLYKCVTPGITGASEPNWASIPAVDPLNETAANQTFTDGSAVWKRYTWSANAYSTESLTDDGGAISTTVETTRIVVDNFNRGDDPNKVGKTQSGQDYTVLRGGSWGISGNRAYCVTLPGGGGHTYLITDSKLANGIVQATFSMLGGNNQLCFRFTDGNNGWYVAAGTGRYVLYKRVANVETLVTATDQAGMVATTPANNDIVKVLAIGASIKVYVNSALVMWATDSFNQGATQHGIGTRGNTGFGSARFDDFEVRQTYTTRAFGFNYGGQETNTDWSTVKWGWYLDQNRNARTITNGAVGGAALTYSDGMSFKVEVRRDIYNGTLQCNARYYYQPYGSTEWVLWATASVGQSPQPSVSNPLYVAAAFYDTAAALDNLLLERFTYGLYTDAASVALYGYWWAPSVIRDATLDTDSKRQARAQAIFSRYAQPRETIKVKTTARYSVGRMVLINNRKLGWTNVLKMIVAVETDRSTTRNRKSPIYIYTLGDFEREWGDSISMAGGGGIPPDPRARPPKPTGLTAGVSTWSLQTDKDRQVFSWDKIQGNAQFVELVVYLLDNTEVKRVAIGATLQSGGVDGLDINRQYVARIIARGYNGQPSEPSDPVYFVTCDRGFIPQSTNLAYTSTYDGTVDQDRLDMTWTAPPGISRWRVIVGVSGGQITTADVDTPSHSVMVPPGSSGAFGLLSITPTGIVATVSVSLLFDAVARPAMVQPPAPTVTNGGGVGVFVPAASKARTQLDLQVTMPAEPVMIVQPPIVLWMEDGETVTQPFSATIVGSTYTGSIFVKPGALIQHLHIGISDIASRYLDGVHHADFTSAPRTALAQPSNFTKTNTYSEEDDATQLGWAWSASPDQYVTGYQLKYLEGGNVKNYILGLVTSLMVLASTGVNITNVELYALGPEGRTSVALTMADFTTASPAAPQPPGSPSVTTNTYRPKTRDTLAEGTATPSPSKRVVSYELRFDMTSEAGAVVNDRVVKPETWVDDTGVLNWRYAFPAGASVSDLRLRAVDSRKQTSSWSAAGMTFTAETQASEYPDNLGLELVDPNNSLYAAYWQFSGPGPLRYVSPTTGAASLRFTQVGTVSHVPWRVNVGRQMELIYRYWRDNVAGSTIPGFTLYWREWATRSAAVAQSTPDREVVLDSVAAGTVPVIPADIPKFVTPQYPYVRLVVSVGSFVGATALNLDFNGYLDVGNIGQTPTLPTASKEVVGSLTELYNTKLSNGAGVVGQTNLGLADPVNSLDAATKQYVDKAAHQPVRACTFGLGNITLSGTQTLDTVALVAGDRVLVASQTTGSQNGIYVVASGTWSRASDMDTSAKVLSQMRVAVQEGTSNGGTMFMLTTTGTITLGTTSLSFGKATAVPAGTAGGDLTGSYPNPSVGTGVITPAKLSFTPVKSGDAAGGHLTGTYPSPSIASGVVTEAMLASSLMGTSWPASPVDGQQFFNKSYQQWGKYKAGVGWLAAETVVAAVGTKDLTTAGVIYQWIPLPPRSRSAYIVSIGYTGNVPSTNNGTNYYIALIQRLDTGATVVTINTSTLAAGSRLSNNTAQGITMPANANGFYVSVNSKVGAPTTLELAPYIIYQEVLP